MKTNNSPYREKCKSCNQDFHSTTKTVKPPNDESYSFQEVLCNKCLSKYITNIDMLELNNYAHQNVSQGLTVPREYKDFVD